MYGSISCYMVQPFMMSGAFKQKKKKTMKVFLK